MLPKLLLSSLAPPCQPSSHLLNGAAQAQCQPPQPVVVTPYLALLTTKDGGGGGGGVAL